MIFYFNAVLWSVNAWTFGSIGHWFWSAGCVAIAVGCLYLARRTA